MGKAWLGGYKSRQELTKLRGGPGPRLQVRGRTRVPVRGPANEWRALPQNLATRPSKGTETGEQSCDIIKTGRKGMAWD